MYVNLVQMKRTIVIAAAMAFSYGVQAQSLDEGVKMYKYEKYTSAERILTPLAANDAKANYYLGLAQLGQENIPAATATFAKYPSDAANMAGMARIAFVQNDVAKGTQIAQSIADKAKKKDWESLKYAADAITYTTGGNAQTAVEWYKKALQIEDNADLHISLGDAYQKIPGGGGEAMSNYEKVTDKDAKNSLAFSRIGALWYAARNYDKALEAYAKAKEADPANPLPYRDLANAYQRVGKYNLALENIKKYLELSDNSVDDKIQYADILYLSKNYNEAIKVINELMNSGVKKARFFGLLGYSQLEIKDSVNALKNIKEYLAKQDPKKIYPTDYLNYAKAFMMNSMGDSANFYFNKAIQADTSKNKSDIYRQIAEGFKDAKNYTVSAQWYDKLITENPAAEPIDYFWAGVMYFYAKDYTNAANVFERYETKHPDQPSATYWRGRVGAAIDNEGKEGTAVPHFTKWVEKVGPDYEKKNDLKLAYEYLLLYYYNKNDKANEKIYMDKILAIDPEDDMVKQIKKAEAASKK